MDVKRFNEAAAAFPDACFSTPPDVAIVLGSGWGDALAKDETLVQVPYDEIPGLGAAAVTGHAGMFILYRRAGKLVAAFCGRRHWYEGVGWEAVTLPVEMARRMGARDILLTNAAGGVNPALKPGDFVILRDHVNTVGVNPLMGAHNPDWGTRFPDMSEVYAQHGRDILHAAANRLGYRAMEGIYAFSAGPVYETPAEVRAYARMGADAVGMSTVPEAVFAHACGLRVSGLSFISNLAAGISPHPLAHEEVLAASREAKPRMAALLDAFVQNV